MIWAPLYYVFTNRVDWNYGTPHEITGKFWDSFEWATDNVEWRKKCGDLGVCTFSKTDNTNVN